MLMRCTVILQKIVLRYAILRKENVLRSTAILQKKMSVHPVVDNFLPEYIMAVVCSDKNKICQ